MYKVLVIDDDPIFQYIAEKIFNKANLFSETCFYQDARAALRFLEDNKDKPELLPDVILLDIYMPLLNGWDFLNAFDPISTTLKKSIPVYLLSSSIDPKEIARSKTHKTVRSYTSKPMTNEFVEYLYKDCVLLAS